MDDNLTNLHDVLKSKEDKAMAKLPGWPWDYQSTVQANMQRILMALIGSVLLLAPMIFMIFKETRAARVGAVAVCTVTFAFFLAILSKETPLGLLKTTAAYTAFLVVFVGTTTQ